MKKISSIIVATISLLLLFVLLLDVFSTKIPVGYIGVKVNMYGTEKGIVKKPLDTGRVWYNPFTQDVIKFPTFMQTAVWTSDEREGSRYDESIDFQTKDGMKVIVNVSLNYMFEGDKAPLLYEKFRKEPSGLEKTYLRTQVRKVFVDVASTYRVEEFITNKAKFLNEVEKRIKNKLDVQGFRVDTLTIIGSPVLPKTVMDSIEMKIKATQLAEQKKRELEQAKADAEKLVAKREGEARARIAEAEGIAKSKLIEAQAIAKANKLINQSLTRELIEYQKIKKWNGQLPNVTAGSNNGLLLNVK